MPERIQLRRTKGWRMPEGAVSVARPTRWGNPWTAETEAILVGPREWLPAPRSSLARIFRWRLVDCNGEGMLFTVDDVRRELRGKDLACWCPLEDENGNRVPCHADVLLEVANAPR